MPVIRPFCAVRPDPAYAERIAALPYDVYSEEEARRAVEGRPLSFLRIDRAETQFPEGTDPYAPQVYERARDTLAGMKAAGAFVQDEEPCLYLYALTMEGRTQTGLAACASVDDYLDGVIKKHENTREDKEQDRIRHVDVCSAHTGPIFLTYRGTQEIQSRIAEAAKKTPLYDFISEDGIGHRVWKIEDPAWIREMTELFGQMDSLYIADGHHRAASAVKVGLRRREAQPDYTGEEEFNYFLSVIFPAEELKIYDYNRVIHGLTESEREELPGRLEKKFIVERRGQEPVRPGRKGEMGLYVNGCWYLLTAKEDVRSEDPVEGLDVSVLQREVLEDYFGVYDPKTDPRMQFVGGIRGLGELQRIVDLSGDAAAFAMYPTSMEELLQVADHGLLMPPKSTWFEPKLRSGLFIHEF